MKNLVKDKKYSKIKNDLEEILVQFLKKRDDKFLPGMEYIKKWKYVIDKTGTVPYEKMNYQGLPVE